MSISRLLIAVGFILAIALGGVAGYFSVDPVVPEKPAAKPATPAPQASGDGDYGPDWPVCRDMSNEPLVRFKACDNVLARGGMTKSHQSWALNNRGTANLGMSNTDAALKDFTSASKIDPTNTSPYINLANVARSYGRLNEALELSDKAIALQPSEYAYCSRAAVLRDQGRLEEGLAAIDAAEKLGPLSDCSKLVRADLLERRGQNDKAALALADVGEDDRTASHAVCERARLKIEEGKTREAFDLYAQGMRLDPDNACAARHAAYYAPYVMPFDEALGFVKKAMATHPNLHSLNCDLGRVYKMQGDPRKALAAYNTAIERAPTDSCGYAERGQYWLEQGDLKAALSDYDAAGRLRPKRTDIWKGRGKVMAKLGRNQDALASYDRALAEAPEDAEALQLRGDLRMALQFYPKAIEDFDKLADLQPNTTYARYRLALANFAAKSPGAAIEACRTVPIDDVWEASCRLLEAEAMLLGGDLSAALAKLKELPPQSPLRRQGELLEAGILLMDGKVDAAGAVVERYRATYPDQLYGAVWGALAAKASGTPIPADIEALADANDIWPTPVLRWLVRGGTPADLLAAADTPDARLSLQRVGEAELYLGLNAMLAGDEKAAVRYFNDAAKSGYAEQDKDSYPAAYSFSNGREFALAAWAASGGR
jgi:tetratricopeptide (TPR) repeat protein